MPDLNFKSKTPADLRSEIPSGVSSIFLVRGKSSYERTGAKSFIDKALLGFKIVEFFDFDPNPCIEDVLKGLELFSASDCSLIVAVGGGSVIDMAKAIKAMDGVKADDVKGNIESNIISDSTTKLIAIPTTSGTGSEATHFGVVYIGDNKYSLAASNLLPDAILHVPEFTFSLSPYLTGCTGFDAFCQAIEALWSVNATETSINYSSLALSLISGNFELALTTGSPESREAMMKASYLAGKAINIAKTTAAHAISYSITKGFGVPHGHAVALTIRQFVLLNLEAESKALTPKGDENAIKQAKKVALEAMSFESLEELNLWIKKCLNIGGMQETLSKYTDSVVSNLDIVKNNINQQRLSNNPVLVTDESLNSILDSIK